MLTAAIIIATLFIGFATLINLSVKNSVKSLTHPENLLEEVDQIDDKDFQQAFTTVDKWAIANEFSHQLFFHFSATAGNPIFCASWKNPKNNALLLLYAKEKSVNFELFSTFGESGTLTTASSKDAIFLPKPPSNLVQAITKRDIGNLYQIHIWTKRKLEETRNTKAISPNSDLIEEISESMRAQAKYIISLPLWSIRGFYWYFITRNLKSDRLAITPD